MKKILFALFAVTFACGTANATFTILRDAGNLSRGILPNQRLDPSSVTLQGDVLSVIKSTTANLAYDGGSVNTITNPVDWNQLKNVPAGFADGTDDGSGGSSTVENSTRTMTIGFGGEVFFATNSIVPVPGAFGAVSRTTINVVGVQAFLNVGSTVGATGFRIAVSTALGGGSTPFSYMSPNVIVDTATTQSTGHYSVFVSTQFKILSQSRFSLHITTCPTNGILPSDGGMNIEYWTAPK